MSKKKKDTIYAGDFNCRVPLIMLEKCAKCPKEGRCKYSKGLLLQIIKCKKKLSYEKPD